MAAPRCSLISGHFFSLHRFLYRQTHCCCCILGVVFCRFALLSASLCADCGVHFVSFTASNALLLLDLGWQNVSTYTQHVPLAGRLCPHTSKMCPYAISWRQNFLENRCLLKLADFKCDCLCNFCIFGLWLHPPLFWTYAISRRQIFLENRCLLKLANFKCGCLCNFCVFGLWLHPFPYSGPMPQQKTNVSEK